MPLRFSIVCALFYNLEAIANSNNQLTKERESAELQAIDVWFRAYRTSIDAKDTDGHALFSCLLPERRPDRVYGFAKRVSSESFRDVYI